MNVHAYIIPVLGPAQFKGDVATVVAGVTGMLRTHPGYTFSIRRRDKGEKDSGYAVLIWRDGDDYAFRSRLGSADTTAQRDGLAELTAEILAVLNSLSIQPTQEHPQ